MVTHDNHLATFADRIFHIIDGKIVKVEERDHSKDEEIVEAASVEELLKKEVLFCSITTFLISAITSADV